MSQRSSINFWLLLAATLGANAVAIVWTYAMTLQRSESFYFGLACSQISVATIWACFADVRRFWRWTAPFLFTFVAVLVTSWLYSTAPSRPMNQLDLVLADLGLWMAQVVVLLVGLWVARQTTFGQRWDGSDATIRWQFSMWHLLVSMTVLATLIVIVRHAKVIHEVWGAFVLWIVNNSALAMAAAMIRATRWRGLMRLAATFGIAGILGLTFAAVSGFQARPHAMNLIQAIVLYLWLEWGGIIPHLSSDVGPLPPTSPPPAHTTE